MYGSLTFDAGYVERCRGLVTELGLQNNVELRGLGKPTDVLAQGWCYLQVGCWHVSLLESLPNFPSGTFPSGMFSFTVLNAAVLRLCMAAML